MTIILILTHYIVAALLTVLLWSLGLLNIGAVFLIGWGFYMKEVGELKYKIKGKLVDKWKRVFLTEPFKPFVLAQWAGPLVLSFIAFLLLP